MGTERARRDEVERRQRPARAPEGSSAPVGLGPLASPEAVLALQRMAGNRAVSSALSVQRSRGAKNRRNRSRGRGSSGTGTGTGTQSTTGTGTGTTSTTGTGTTSTSSSTTVTQQGSTLVIPVETSTVKSTTSVIEQVKETTPTGTPTSTPQPSTTDRVGEITGNVTGGILDVWEGVETVVDPSKDLVTRGGGGTKVVSGTTGLLSTIGKELGLVGDQGMSVAGRINETCGVLGAVGEFAVSANNAWTKGGAVDALFDLLQKIAGVAGSALKALDAYLDLSKKYETFEKLIAKGVVPGIAIVTAAIKFFTKIAEMSGLSSLRAALMTEIEKHKKHKRKKRQDQGETASKLIETIDSKWYRALVDVISSSFEISGELLKWGDVTTGWITGNVMSGMAKAVPFAYKVLPVGYSLFTKFSSWLWSFGGATTTPNGGTVVVKGEWDDLRDLIKERRNDPFGELLCKTIGLDKTDANDDLKIEGALKQFAA